MTSGHRKIVEVSTTHDDQPVAATRFVA